MKILFVAMAESVHTARWIRQLDGQGHDIHLFSPLATERLHQDLYGKVTYHTEFSSKASGPRVRGIPVGFPLLASAANIVTSRLVPERRRERLANLIKRLRPDVVHSMEFQAAGYLSLEVQQILGPAFPPWVVSNWGSDVYLFGQLSEHQRRLKALLSHCNYYVCECHRDIGLAKQLGLRGEVIGVIPAGGGLPLGSLQAYRSTPPSQRKKVLLKGYQGWAGRALCGLRAIELVADVLRPYEINVYFPNPEVELKARLVAENTGLAVRLLPRSSHETMLRLHGQARMSIGLSISDAASTSFLEAIAMGSFPVQSNTACADEWVEDGTTGLLVPPEDPQHIAAAIHKAATDNELVDEAAKLNWQVVTERLKDDLLRAQIVGVYQRIAQRGTTISG